MTTELSIGREIGGYRIEALIGRGGMGVVYRAEDLRLGRKVALKVLAPEVVENEAFRARFDRESRLAAAIDHPNIIPLYEAREVDGLLFITMRYVEGTDLRALLVDSGRLPPARALDIVSQLAGALDAAHQRGLVHRDVKPANVLVAPGSGPGDPEHCYLTDFGLTKDTSSSEELTEAGQFVGTLEYVAPEQIESAKPDGRADLYALGCVLFECLTGAPPFKGDSDIAIMYGHLQGERPLITELRAELPKGLDHVMTKALARAPEDRYATCGAFIAAVRAELDTAGLTKVSPTPGAPGAAPVAPAGMTRIARAGPTRLARAGEPALPAAAGVPAPTQAAPASQRMPRVPAILVAALAVGIAALAGILVGNTGGGNEKAASNVAAAGTLRLSFPDTWQSARDPGIPGLKLSNPVALAPRTGKDAGLLTGGVSDHDARLLPSGIASRVSGEPARDAVKLGDAEAFRFRNLTPQGYSGHLTLYVVPTSAGLDAIGCFAPAQTSPVLADCDEIAASLSLAGATALAVKPSSSYAKALSSALDALAAARTSGRTALKGVKTAKGQVGPANTLAAAYRKAQTSVRGLKPPALAAALNKAIATDLGDAASAYSRMATAAGKADSGGFASARGAVTAAEAALRRALDGLAGLGYGLKT